MSADAPIVSRPYHPKMCCERCTFGSGEHAEWCHPSSATVTFTVEATWPSTEQPSGITQTYYIATDEQKRAYRSMLTARIGRDAYNAIFRNPEE